MNLSPVTGALARLTTVAAPAAQAVLRILSACVAEHPRTTVLVTLALLGALGVAILV